MSDPVVTMFSRAATLMVARFVDELSRKDPEMCNAVYAATKQGERLHVGMTCGGGEVRIDFETINDYGARRLVASITESMPVADPFATVRESGVGH